MWTAEWAFGAPLIQFCKFWLAPKRFGEIAFKRRTVEETLDNGHKISGGEMKKQLGWISFMAFGTGMIIATGIFSFMPYIYAFIAGPAVILSLLVASGTSALSAIVYSEFAVEMPVVGGGFVYTMVVFGEFPAMLCGVNLVIDYIFGGAAVLRNFSVYLSQLLNKDTDIFVTTTDFAELDYMALAISLLLALIAMLSMTAFNEGNNVVQVIHVLLVLFVMIAGFAKAETANWQPFFPFGSRAILTGAANIFFVFVGYDVIALGAEEAKTHSDVPKGMVGSVFCVTVIYVLMTCSIIMLIPAAVLAEQPSYAAISGFAYAFSYRGLDWAKYIVALGALVGIVTSGGLSIYGLSRIFVMFARERIIPPFVGYISPWTNTPMIATGLCGSAIAIMAFFTSFPDLANMTSIGTLCMFWFVAMAHIYRRYCPGMMTDEQCGDRHLSIRFRPNPIKDPKIRSIWILFLMFMITASAVGFAVYWSLAPDETLWLWLTPLFWFLFTLTLQLTCPIEYVPPMYAVPSYMLPWIPAASIWSTIMVIGGFGAGSEDYKRLGIALCAGCGFYMLYSVHASWWRFDSDDKARSLGLPGVPTKEVDLPVKDVAVA